MLAPSSLLGAFLCLATHRHPSFVPTRREFENRAYRFGFF